MKYARTLGIAWIILSIYDLFWGFYFLYQYSAPGVFWFYMVPEWITFGKIFLGTFGLIIGISIFRTGKHPLLLPFLTLLLTFIIIDFVKIGIELVNDTGSNLLFFGLTLFTSKLSIGLEQKNLEIFRKRKTLIFLTIGLAPYYLRSWIAYDWFNFLH